MAKFFFLGLGKFSGIFLFDIFFFLCIAKMSVCLMCIPCFLHVGPTHSCFFSMFLFINWCLLEILRTVLVQFHACVGNLDLWALTIQKTVFHSHKRPENPKIVVCEFFIFVFWLVCCCLYKLSTVSGMPKAFRPLCLVFTKLLNTLWLNSQTLVLETIGWLWIKVLCCLPTLQCANKGIYLDGMLLLHSFAVLNRDVKDFSRDMATKNEDKILKVGKWWL